MKKKKNKKICRLLLFALIIIIVVILCCKFIFKKKNSVEETIIGKWTTDGVTVYQFNNDNIGVLIVPLSQYDFKYEIDEDSLLIDFISEKSEDSKYTYTLKDGELKLKGANGTFNFKRYIEK